MDADIHLLDLGADGQMCAASARVDVAAINRHMRVIREGYNTSTYFVRRHGECFTTGVFVGNDKDLRGIVAAGLAARIVCERLDPNDGPDALTTVLVEAHRALAAVAEGSRALEPELLARASEYGVENMLGLGASCAVAVIRPDELWFTGVGECSVWLLEDTGARELLVPEILGRFPPKNIPAHISRDELEQQVARFAHVVINVLGYDNPERGVRPAQRLAFTAPVVVASPSIHDILERDPPPECSGMQAQALLERMLARADTSILGHDTCVVAVPAGDS